MKQLLNIHFYIKLLFFPLVLFLFACSGSKFRYVAENAPQTDTIYIDIE